MNKIILLFGLLISINTIFGQPTDQKSATNPAPTQGKKMVQIDEAEFQQLWKDVISSSSTIYEKTNTLITVFGILITVLIVTFSLLNYFDVKVSTKEQIKDIRDSTQKDILLKDVISKIPSEIDRKLELAIKKEFDNKYRDIIYKWTLNQVKYVMGASHHQQELMQAYQRKQANKIESILIERLGDKLLAKEIKELINQNARDTLNLYRLLSGEKDIVILGLMEFAQFPNPLFEDAINEINGNGVFKKDAEIQHHITVALNSLNLINKV